MKPNIIYRYLFLGVTKVDANVESKAVVVTCEETVDSATLLGALQKWSESSGKTVELLA